MTDQDRAEQQAILKRNAALMARFGDDRRGGYAATCALTPIADGVTFSEASEPEARGWWATPPASDRSRAVLFIHGGGYHLGDAASYRGFASQIAVRTQCPVLALDYPLAPEQRFPSAYEAARRARDWLAGSGLDAYALMGDSAGGALALALLADTPPARRPASVAVFSPWTDLALTGASFNDPGMHDPVFKPEVLAGLARSYLGGADPRDGRASPLYGVPEEAPPILVQAGTAELLLDDSRRYAETVAAGGTATTLQLFEGLHHVFQRDAGNLGMADKALDQVARFVAACWSGDPVQGYRDQQLFGS